MKTYRKVGALTRTLEGGGTRSGEEKGREGEWWMREDERGREEQTDGRTDRQR